MPKIDLSKFAIPAERKEDLDVVRTRGPLESGVYEATIDMAYMHTAASGAVAVFVKLETAAGNKLEDRIYITSSDAKGNAQTYQDKKTGEVKTMPGLLKINALCELVVGKEFSEMNTEEKTIKLWSFEEKQEVPVKKEVFMELVGKKVHIGVLKVIENKRAPDGNGNWGPTNDMKTINEVDKYFDENRLSLKEKQTGQPSKYCETWERLNTGKDKNKFVPVPGAPVSASTGSAEPTPSATTRPLFSKD